MCLHDFMASTLLTKSKYLNGIQCLKYLWFVYHDKEKIPPFDDETQFRFSEGEKIGNLAKKLFPNGVDIPYHGFKENLNLTRDNISKRLPLFEPSFMINNCYARVDILNPVGDDEWDLIEVKSSTAVKEINVHDVSFQKYCLEKAGIKIRNCYLMYINNSYIRDGDIDPSKLFTQSDITSQVDEIFPEVQGRVEVMKRVILNIDRNVVDIPIGTYCAKPYACPMKEHCWKHIPEHSIFNIYRVGKKAFTLYENNILKFTDVPSNIKLSEKQKIQLDVETNKDLYINEEKIVDFFSQLKFPLYLMDFETYNSAIPKFDSMKPYQQIPFQFSVHRIDSWGAQPVHTSYIHKENSDSRDNFLMNLKECLGEDGSIIVYNQSFEIRILKDLIEKNPEMSIWLDGVLPRIVDLLIPFRNFDLYHYNQNGSCSIKYVLPSFTDESYSSMNIANGAMASLEYFNAVFNNKTFFEQEEVFRNLEEYCGLDTIGMLWIMEKMKDLVNLD